MAQQDINKVRVSIEALSVLKVVGILIGVWVLWLLRDIAVLLFVCLVLASALDPTVDYLQRYKIPRALGTVIIYIVVIAAFLFAIIGIAGPIATEFRAIGLELPRYYAELDASFNSLFQQSPTFFTPDRVQTFKGGLDNVVTNLTTIASGNAISVLSSIFGGAVSVLLALVITFYFIVQESSIKQFFTWAIPSTNQVDVPALMKKIQMKLGLWLRGQLLLSVIIFIVTYVGLKVLGVKYALVLALLAGLFEIIPYLGPVLGAIPAVLLTLVAPEWGGMFKAFLVICLFVVIQQAENNFLVPKVMAKTVGLNPIVVIVSILVGAQIAGVVGALIAVPVATAVSVYIFERGLVKGANVSPTA